MQLDLFLVVVGLEAAGSLRMLMTFVVFSLAIGFIFYFT